MSKGSTSRGSTRRPSAAVGALEADTAAALGDAEVRRQLAAFHGASQLLPEALDGVARLLLLHTKIEACIPRYRVLCRCVGRQAVQCGLVGGEPQQHRPQAALRVQLPQRIEVRRRWLHLLGVLLLQLRQAVLPVTALLPCAITSW
jgi:hypothetical protein